MSFIVELEKGVWIAQWIGDPGRTLSIKYAEKFKTKRQAEKRLDIIRREHLKLFSNAIVNAIEID